MPKEFSAEQRQLLTEEELEGLKDLDKEIEDMTGVSDDEEDAAPAASNNKAAAEPDKDKEAAKPEGAADPEAGKAAEAGEEQTEATPAPGDPPVQQQTQEQQPAPAAARPTTVLPRYEAPADIDQKLADIDAKRAELAEKFDDGELTAKEFREQDSALENEKAELREQRLKASLSTDAVVKSWSDQVGEFLAKPGNERYAPGSAAYVALDAEVRRLQADRLQNGGEQFDPAILEEANANVLKAFGIEAPAPKANALPGNASIPPTLQNLPASDPTSVQDGGEFAYLDKLDGEAYEAALSKLTTEQRDRYLAQG